MNNELKKGYGFWGIVHPKRKKKHSFGYTIADSLSVTTEINMVSDELSNTLGTFFWCEGVLKKKRLLAIPKIRIFAPLSAPMPRTGGRRATKHIKGVESTSYLRLTESGKFKSSAR